MDKEFYSYPCEDSDCCINFLESGNKMSFEEFCLKYCENCPDCVVLDVPYGKTRWKNEHKSKM
jgi:hypothetical protein